VSEQTPADQTPEAPAPGPLPSPRGEAVTEGGYAYTLVDETPGVKKPRARRELKPLRIAWPLLVALIVVPAVAAGAAAWFVSSLVGDDESGGGDRTNANVSSVINVFGQSQGGRVLRLEGELPTGLPDDLPAYPGAAVVSSLAQSNGDDVVYLIVYDTPASLPDVTAYFDEAFDDDPWQVDVGQDSAESSARQFTKIDDADIEGQVITVSSKEREVTTIFLILQVVAGASDVEFEEFTPPVSKPLPEGFPDGFPTYPDAVITETIFQREPQADTFGITLITRDSAESALDFFRQEFQGKGWTVSDADPSGSTIENAIAIGFESDDATVTGTIAAGQFEDDRNYTQVELQVRQLDDDGE
jgi:hypothetical protein